MARESRSHSPATESFSLFQDDLINRLFRIIGLGPERLIHILGRIAILIGLTWVPVALLASYSDVGTDQPPGQNFFLDLAAYAQFFIGLPLFVFAEYVIARSTEDAAAHFRSTGLLPKHSMNLVERWNARIRDLRTARWSDVVCLAIGYVLVSVWIWPELHNATETWHALGPVGHQSLTAAGAWEVFIALPLLDYWWLRWIWKIGLWCWYLAKLSSVQLSIVASHPDETGGLGFLSDVQTKFGWVILAYGVTNIAATVAYKLTIEQTPATFMAVWGPMVSFIIGAPLVFSVPLFMFTKQLHHAKRRALAHFHRNVTERALMLERTWMQACDSKEYAPMIDAEVAGLNSIHALYNHLQKMRVVPLDLRSFAELVGYATGPFLPLVSLLERLQAQWMKDFIHQIFG